MKYNQLNTKKFIEKATQIHDDKYDYSKTNYINNHTKIIIGCLEHGYFEQTPANHLSGQGCRHCGKIKRAISRRSDPTDVLTKAREIHGNKYEYPDFEYNGCKDKMSIKCPIHGLFEQIVSSHLSGYGCPDCGREKISSTFKYNFEKFKQKANEIHNYRYSYDEKSYINSSSKVNIVCNEHGPFTQRANAHLSGQGCPNCGDIKTKQFFISNREEFINKAKILHGDRYNYDNVNYIKSNIKIKIGCYEHGYFEQTPNNHLSKKAGCPCCNSSKGEVLISQILNKNNIQYLREYKIPGTKYRFEYDFYLPQYNLLIEFQGIQHYKPIEYFGGEENLKYVKRNDIFKKELAKLAKIKLIEFNYKQLKHLNKKEFEKLVLRNIK